MSALDLGAEESPAPRHRFRVNGRDRELRAPGGRRLLDVLRLDLGLTGAKEGCGEGECGACSVLLDGEVVDSCLVPISQVAGREVRTVEGLAANGQLDPLQAALIETGGVQCGICTPGMLMAGRAFLDSGRAGAAPTDQAIREAIAGNLCRCTGYGRIIEAIRRTGAAPISSLPGPEVSPHPAANFIDETELTRRGLDLADPAADTPQTLAEAYALLAQGGRRIIAGGTDVLVERLAGIGLTPRYLDLSGLAELHQIRRVDDWLVLGASTTYAELRRSRLAAEDCPVLVVLAGEVGAAQIQNRGTLGGNIATASPAGDSLPLWLALDAQIVVGSLRGERTIPAAAFFPTYRRTALADDEIILRIRVPIRPAGTAVFRKVGPRRAQAISVVSLAAAWRSEQGTWHDVRIALGSVAPTPIRAPTTEAVLEGARPTPETAERATATLRTEIAPIDDVRSSADYRRTVAGRLLHRIIREAGGW